jgi:hypothetical protein
MSLCEIFYAKQLIRKSRGLVSRRRRVLPREQRPILFEPLEPRLLLAASPLLFDMAVLQPTLAPEMTVRVVDDAGIATVQIVDGSNQVQASRALADTSAVAVVDDQSNVTAAISDGPDAESGAHIERADQVAITADRTVAIDTSTVAAAAAVGAAGGAGVTVASAGGDTVARVGDWAQIGTDANPRTVNSLSMNASSTATIGPFGVAKTMAVALGVAGGGAAAAGVAVATINVNTEALIGDDVTVDTSGLVSLEATSGFTLDVDADGGAAALFVGIGTMIAHGNIGLIEQGVVTRGVTRAHAGSRARIHAGGLVVKATNTSDAAVDMVGASGGIFTGNGGEAKAAVTPRVDASLAGDTSLVEVTGDVAIEATSLRAEANASAKSFEAGVW